MNVPRLQIVRGQDSISLEILRCYLKLLGKGFPDATTMPL